MSRPIAPVLELVFDRSCRYGKTLGTLCTLIIPPQHVFSTGNDQHPFPEVRRFKIAFVFVNYCLVGRRLEFVQQLLKYQCHICFHQAHPFDSCFIVMKVQALRYELLRVLRLNASRYPFVWRRKPGQPLIDTKASERYLHYIPYCKFSDLVFFILRNSGRSTFTHGSRVNITNHRVRDPTGYIMQHVMSQSYDQKHIS